MNMSAVYEECMNNKDVPEIHSAALLKLKASVRAISVESTLALNPWCFGAKVVYVHTPGTHPPHCKAIHDSLSVLPKLEKSQETWSNTSAWQIIAPPQQLVPPLIQVSSYVRKSLNRVLKNTGHLQEWSTRSEGEAASHSEIKCCKKHFNKHMYMTNHY